MSDGGVPDASEHMVDAAATADGSSPGTCTLLPSGARTGRCTRENRSCTPWGLAVTQLTYKGCADEFGFGGNPQHSVSTCEQALLGESGERCTADLTCGARATDDDCCIDRAECSEGGTLRVARLCVPGCGAKESRGGPVIAHCSELYAAAAAAVHDSPERPWGLDLIGRECDGDMICGRDFGDPDGASKNAFSSSYGHYAFCAHGRLQLISEGPSPLPLSDADPYP